MRRAPAERRRIARRIGCSLLEAPTGSGKTVILASTAEAVCRDAQVIWFWFAPFSGLVMQTGRALRAVAPGLRVRDPGIDRSDVGSKTGDVFVTTWASVAARNVNTRRMRLDDDFAPAIQTLLARLRKAGFLIGAVVDEAHHSFRPNTEAFRFFDAVLDPDLLMCATATPNDADVELVRRALDIARFQRVSVSRERVVDARLNKKFVRAVSFVARGVARELVDLNETALRKAVEQHRALKRALRDAGFPIVPLLLVQAASTSWTPSRVRDFLREKMSFSEAAVGVHTADEPDPDVQALADDPAVEVLIFKMAVATGFDAPRAATLCALRPVADASFGVQVVGRIMRVHPLLQPRLDLSAPLDTGWVFLGDADGQAGLQSAAERIKAIKDSIEVATDSVAVYEATVGGDGQLVVTGEDGQSVFVLEPPPEQPEPGAMTTRVQGGAQPLAINDTLFGQLSVMMTPTLGPSGVVGVADDGSAARAAGTPARAMPYRYPQRPGLVVPERLRTERMPRDARVLLDALIRQVVFTAEHFAAARRVMADVERRDRDLFEAAAEQRRHEQADISDLFAREAAYRLLRVSDYLDPAEVGRRLQVELAAQMRADGQTPPEGQALRRAVNVVLAQFPTMLREALRRAAGACAEVIDAADLPKTWDSAVALPESPRNLFGRMPSGLNTWEQRFAEWLDSERRVIWWTRNPARPNALVDWSVRIVLPESGRGYYPDFVVYVDGRRRGGGICLAETKERTETEASGVKSRTEHREYGRALMLADDPISDRFFKVEYATDIGRNREVGLLRSEDLLE
jgi:hypothetical protein